MRRPPVLALALSLVGACSESAPGDPDRAAFQPHPLYQLEPIPNDPGRAGTGPHEATGLRGAPLAPAAPVRVLVLGGGAVYGVGVAASEALPARLGAALRASGVEASVANGGCPRHVAATAMLRTHFLLAAAKPTHVVYVAGDEDLDVYAAPDFVPDLGHVPRPWTGRPFPKAGALGPAGADAYRRDLASLEVVARTAGARAIFALPGDRKLDPLRAPMERAASDRQAPFLALPPDRDVALQTLARAVAGK